MKNHTNTWTLTELPRGRKTIKCKWTRKQQTVSISSTEAKYNALTQCACEAMWLRYLLNKQVEPTKIFEDNQACIGNAQERKEHKRMKHVDVTYN